MLQASVDKYFSDGELRVIEQWITYPYFFNADQIADSDVLKVDLIDLKENQTMKLLFDVAELERFWCSIMQRYKNVSTMQSYKKLNTKALSILVPFATTYLCKSGFFSLSFEKEVSEPSTVAIVGLLKA